MVGENGLRGNRFEAEILETNFVGFRFWDKQKETTLFPHVPKRGITKE